MPWFDTATPGRQSQTKWLASTRQCGGRDVRTRRRLFVAFLLPLLWTAPIFAGKGSCLTQALQAPDKYKGIVPVDTRRFVRKAHDRGIRVDVWTIDDEAAMRRLLSFGVDGIMTDRPDVLAGVLNSR